MKKQDTEKVKALKKEVEKDLRAANMRIRRMEAKGENSPALQKLSKNMEDNNPRFRMGKNPSYNDLQKLHAEIKRYLNMETSTLRGWDAVKKRTIETLKKRRKNPIEITKDQFNKFWESYEKLKETDKSILENQLKYGVLDYISKMIDDDENIDVDDIIKEMGAKINEIYIEQQKQNAAFDAGASQMFSGQ